MFSLVTGGLVANPAAAEARWGRRAAVPLAYDDDGAGEGGEGALVERGAREIATTGWRSEAAEFLANREFRGLEPRVGETAPAEAVEGRRGIASDYGGA